jgi:serine/threonine protein kinase
MIAQFVVISGPDQGMVIPLLVDQPLLLGRGQQAQIQLQDQFVSRLHCQIELRAGHIFVTDRNSAGGTFVNGQRIVERKVTPADVVHLGETRLRLQLKGEAVSDGPTLNPDALALPLPIALPDNPSVSTATTIPPPPSPSRSRMTILPRDRLGELTGRTVGHFKVAQVLGKGQSGLVFQAYDLDSGRQVAFKVLWPEFSKNREEIQRFIRAMKTVLPLRHPNLVALYGAGKKEGYCWVAMELVEGESLTQVLQRIGVGGRLDWRHAYRTAVHLARALAYAHEHQILHRNLTPQNVMVRESDKVAKLGDLMLAKALEGNLAQQLTRPGEVLGDIRYMSPERLEGMTHIDHRSDLYSLGALVYALLTGHPPFEGSSLVDTIIKVRSSEPVEPRKYQLGIPDGLQGAVLRLLNKRPEDRYQTAAELLAHLERVGKFQGVTA